eukprot:364683-Chlamydomonas_euryale.AAC.6
MQYPCGPRRRVVDRGSSRHRRDNVGHYAFTCAPQGRGTGAFMRGMCYKCNQAAPPGADL